MLLGVVQIASMTKMLVNAGINPDAVPSEVGAMEVVVTDPVLLSKSSNTATATTDVNVSPTQAQPQLTPQSSSAYISPVQVYDAAVRIVQVQYARHARYNWYVQSMKAAKVRKAPDQVQIQVAPVVPVAQVAPVVPVAQVAPAASIQAPPQVGYPALVALVVPLQAPRHVGYPALVAALATLMASVPHVAPLDVVAPVIAPLAPMAPMDSVALVAKTKYKYQFKTKFKFK